MFGFDDLCNRPLAAADYIALAGRFHTLAVADVPVFSAANRAAAYRFVTLIDVMYEHRWAWGACCAATQVHSCLTSGHDCSSAALALYVMWQAQLTLQVIGSCQYSDEHSLKMLSQKVFTDVSITWSSVWRVALTQCLRKRHVLRCSACCVPAGFACSSLLRALLSSCFSGL